MNYGMGDKEKKIKEKKEKKYIIAQPWCHDDIIKKHDQWKLDKLIYIYIRKIH